MNARQLAVGTFVPMLTNLDGCLAKAPNADPNARLAPDMFTLAQQVQSACFHASDAIGRMTGKSGSMPDYKEEPIAELRARIARAIADVEAAPDLDGDRKIEMLTPRRTTFEMSGWDFLQDWSLPHFYFHVVTAYGILRHTGAQIGKLDYLASVARHIRS